MLIVVQPLIQVITALSAQFSSAFSIETKSRNLSLNAERISPVAKCEFQG